MVPNRERCFFVLVGFYVVFNCSSDHLSCLGSTFAVLGWVRSIWICFLSSMEFNKVRSSQIVSDCFRFFCFSLFKLVKLFNCVAFLLGVLKSF